MTDSQKKLIEDYIDKYGGVNLIELEKTNMVQLQLDFNMVRMEGISFYWLEKFSKEFFEISVGVADKTNEKYGAFITMFTIDIYDSN